MQMNKILLSGLALGKDIGLCPVCNFDFDWLIKNPSSLLWLDKIIVPQNILNTIKDKKSSNNIKLNEGMKLLFEVLEDKNLLEIIKIEDYISNDVANKLYEQTKKDRDILSEMFPEIIKKGDESCPGELFIGDFHYCSSYVWQIYASLFLAMQLNAQLMYTPESLIYCKYKFGASNSHIPNSNTKNDVITNVFNSLIPSVRVFSDFTFRTKEYCEDCTMITSCEKHYLKKTESNIAKILEYRETDELFQIRDVLNEIISIKSSKNQIITQNDINDILNQYKGKAYKINKLLKKYFPKIEKWSNIATLITLPICITGIATGNPIVSGISGIAATGISSTRAWLELLKTKYSWVGFIEHNNKK